MRTARWSTWSTRRPVTSGSPTTPGSEPAQPGVGPLDRPAGRRRHVRAAVAERAVVMTSDYLADACVRPRAGDGSRRRRHRHPLDGRGAARGRRDGLRGAGRLLVARRCVQPRADRARPCAGRPCGRGDAQRRGSSRRSTPRGRELAERADVERSLREIGARISAAADLPAVLQLGVDEAARLLDADGARIDLIDADRRPAARRLRLGRARARVTTRWPDDPDETLDQGVAGQAVVTGRAYLDRRLHQRHALPPRPGVDSTSRRRACSP